MKLLFVDIETCSITFKTTDINDYDVVTEIGMVMCDTDYATPKEPYPVVDMFSKIINCPNRPEMEKECLEITHLSEELVNNWGVVPNKQFCDFMAKCYFQKADVIVASNGNNFDKPVLENFFAHYGSKLPDKLWIDIQRDIDYPGSCRNRNQTYLSGYHNIFNCLSHRSVTDCMTMAKIIGSFDTNGLLYPLDVIIENAKSPDVYVIAKVSFDNKDLAKNDGFRWNPDTKQWYKSMRQNQYSPDNYIFETELG